MTFLALSSAAAAPATTPHASDFCIVPVAMEELKGVCNTEKWRDITAVTIFKNSPNALFFSGCLGVEVQRLAGYQLTPIPASVLPYNELDKDNFLTDSAGNIYGKGRWKEGSRPTLKMDPTSGSFAPLTSEEMQRFSRDPSVTDYHPKYEVKLTDPDRQIIEKDHKRYLIDGDGKPQELERVYGKPNAANMFSAAWINLAGGSFIPFLNDYLVYGRKETKSPINALHALAGDRSTKFLSLQEPMLFRLDKDQFIQVEGSENLKFGQWQEPVFYMLVASRKIVILAAQDGLYYYGVDKKLRHLQGGTAEVTGKYQWVYDMPGLNRVLMRSQNGLFKLNEKNELVPIKLPPELVGAEIYHLVEMPKSNIAAVFTNRGTYVLDAEDNLNRVDNAENGVKGRVDVMNTVLLPHRDEIFVDADGEYMLVDKRISKAAPCR